MLVDKLRILFEGDSLDLSHRSLIFGDESVFAELMGTELQKSDLGEVASLFAKFDAHVDRILAELTIPEVQHKSFSSQIKGLAAIGKSVANRAELKTVADQFNLAWPESNTNVTAKNEADKPDPLASVDFGSIGYLIARDVFEHFNQQRPKVKTQTIPVLFVSESTSYKEDGEVRLLEVEVREDDCCSAFYPDPCFVGLSQLKVDFQQAMQNAWNASGLPAEKVSARWRLLHFPGITTSLHDREIEGSSIEAATVCALWGAYQKRVPRNTEEDFSNLAGLDIRSTVIGAVEDQDPDPTKNKLVEVDPKGIEFKIGKLLKEFQQNEDPSKAGFKIDRVFLPKGQKKELKNLISICGEHIEPDFVDTVGEAMLKLVETFRIMTAYQIQTTDDWDDEYEIPAEEKEIAGDAQ